MFRILENSLYSYWNEIDKKLEILTQEQVQERGIHDTEIDYIFIESITIPLSDDTYILFENEYESFAVVKDNVAISVSDTSQDLYDFIIDNII